MTQRTEYSTSAKQVQPARRRWLLASVSLMIVLLLVSAAFVTGMNRATALAGMHSTVAHPAASSTPCTPSASSWTPTGVEWRLLVTFLVGPRQGQTEVSLMTFACNGTLTVSFPSATPGDPPIQQPISDGQWEMTNSHAFHYRFREILGQEALGMVVQVNVNAFLTSPTTYVAGGIGIAYVTKSNQPLPGQYGVSQTIARVTDAPSAVQTPQMAKHRASVANATLSPEDVLGY